MTEKVQVTFPIVNLNGTTKKDLLVPVMDAYRAVQVAYEAVVKTAPHGRDYQISPAGDYEKARNDFCRRAGHLLKIQEELQTIYIGIQRQKGRDE